MEGRPSSGGVNTTSVHGDIASTAAEGRLGARTCASLQLKFRGRQSDSVTPTRQSLRASWSLEGALGLPGAVSRRRYGEVDIKAGGRAAGAWPSGYADKG